MDHRYLVLDGPRPVGVVILRDVPGRAGEADLTFWIDVPARDRGAATEAVARICVIARDTIGLRRLRSSTRLTDGAAQRVLEKNGFELIGRLRERLLFERLLHGPVTTRMRRP